MSRPYHLICDPAEKPQLEVSNTLLQLDYVTELVVDQSLRNLREYHLLMLHRLAVEGIYDCAGAFRTSLHDMELRGSLHRVPPAAAVQGYVRAALEYANDHNRPALDRAAYLMWRINWIHPFAGGNGRVSRAACYAVLGMDAGAMPPGTPVLPVLIANAHADYTRVLRDGDAEERTLREAWLKKETDDPQPHPELPTVVAYLDQLLSRQIAPALNEPEK